LLSDENFAEKERSVLMKRVTSLITQLKIVPAVLLVGLSLLAACRPAGEERDGTAVPSTTPPNPTDTTPTSTSESGSATDPVTEPAPTDTPDRAALLEKYAEYEIVNLLPRDAIPSIDDPQFVSVIEADEAYDPDELIIGVEINEQPRAYSVPLLSNHEIVNDEIDGIHFAVTW
jgi:hypothetical protein